MEKVVRYLENLLKIDDTIIIACSGGPDSMVLLDLLVCLKTEKNIKVICAHVNHKHRIESDEEEIKVKEYCNNNNIIFELLTITKYNNDKFSEEEARDKRYTFFEELVQKYNAKYLMTAHHGDDLIETILMRISRGSNLKGYIGFKKESKNKNYELIRPLIYIDKDQIMNYCEQRKLWYACDLTNESLLHTRNRYRHYVLPFLKKEDINIHEKYLKFSKELEQYDDFVNRYIGGIIKRIYINDHLDIAELLEEDVFIQKKIIERYITDLQKYNKFYVNDMHLKLLLDIVHDPDTCKTIDLPNGFIGGKEYNEFRIHKKEIINDYKYVLEKEVKISKVGRIYTTTTNEISNFVIRLNSEELDLPLIVRNREDGDRVEIKNMSGTKKIKDIFIDEKVKKGYRSICPIVTDKKNNIIWIPGIKKSKFDKKLDKKYDIILKYEEENNE